MQLILSIDADRRQAEQLSALVAKRLSGVELIQATSAGEALQALGDRVPDLILTSPLLSPFDDGVLAEYLRELGPSAAHVQALRIPVLGTPKPTSGSLFSFGRKKRPEAAPDGCDPSFFADEISVYLARATEEQQAASESQRDAELREVQAFTEPEPDVTPTYVPAYAPEPYVSPYDDADRASFECEPLDQPTEDVAPIYVAPAAPDVTYADPAAADWSESLLEAREPFAYQAPPSLENVDPIPAQVADAPRSESVVAPHRETAVGIAPLAVSDNQPDPELFVLDAASVADQSEFSLNQTEQVEEETPVAVYALDEPYVIEPAETELATAADVSVDLPAPIQPEATDIEYDYRALTIDPAKSVDDEPSVVLSEQELGDGQLDVVSIPEPVTAMATAESAEPVEASNGSAEPVEVSYGSVEEVKIEELPAALETPASSPPPYRIESSHVRVKSRGTVAFETALSAIRRAWGKPRKSQPAPEPVAVADPIATPTTAAASPVDLTPEEVAPQFFDAAPLSAIESDDLQPVAMVDEHRESEPLVVELPLADETVEAATAFPVEVIAPVDEATPWLNDELEPPTMVAAIEPLSLPVESPLAVTEQPAPTWAAPQITIPQAIESPAVDEETESPVLAQTLDSPVVQPQAIEPHAPRDEIGLAPPASTRPTDNPVSAALVDRLIRAVLTKEPITSILANRSAAPAATEPIATPPRHESVGRPLTAARLEEAVDDGIPDAATRAALEVDLTRDINALEEEDFVKGIAAADAQAASAARTASSHPVAPVQEYDTAVPDEDVYELRASPGFHDLETEIAAAAPPRQIRESLPKIETAETEAPQAGTEQRMADKPRKKGDKRKAAPAKPRTPSNRPAQDEWGLFDPNRCGFAALVDKLNEVAEEEDPKANQTTVRVISYR